MEKKEIRKQVFAARKAADPGTMAADSLRICETLMRMPAFQEANTIFVYMDCKGEVSVKPLLETAWAMGKRIAAPKVTGPGSMRYYYIKSYSDLAPGYYGIPEPITQAEAMEEDALLIVPGVAFDKNRHRCGYGQGFYDRYLSAHPGHTTVALAFSFQMVEEVPADEFDIFPDALITEKEIYGDRTIVFSTED